MIGIGRQRIVLLLLLLLRPDVDVAALSADVDGGRCDRSAAQIGVTATVLRLVTAAQTESVMSLAGVPDPDGPRDFTETMQGRVRVSHRRRRNLCSNRIELRKHSNV